MSFIKLTPSTRYQTMLDNTPIPPSDERYTTVRNSIAQFAKQIGQRSPLNDKLSSFERWRKDHANSTLMEQLAVCTTFLCEDGIFYTDERERIVSSEHTDASHKMILQANKDRKGPFLYGRYRKEVSQMLTDMKLRSDRKFVARLAYIAELWHSISFLYPDVTLEWVIEILEKLTAYCNEKRVSDVFCKDEDGHPFLFGRNAREVLDQLLDAPLTDNQYGTAIFSWIPMYCRAEQEQEKIVSRAPETLIGINHTVWQRYQRMCKETAFLNHFYSGQERLIKPLAKLRAFFQTEFKLNMEGPIDTDSLPKSIKRELKRNFKRACNSENDDYNHACEVTALLFHKLSCQCSQDDDLKQLIALIWFLYLTKGQYLLADTAWKWVLPPSNLLKKRFGTANLVVYQKLLFKLQEEFETSAESCAIQRELFLMLTNYPLDQVQLQEFLCTPLMQAYQTVRSCVDRQVHFDPAILKCYPWFEPQRKEYENTGHVELHDKMRSWFMDHQDFLADEKAVLKSGVLSRAAEEQTDEKSLRAVYLETLREMSAHSTHRYLGKDSLLHLEYSSVNNKNYSVPKSLPDIDNQSMRSYFVPCITEYLSLSLLREELFNSLDTLWKDLVKARWKELTQQLDP